MLLCLFWHNKILKHCIKTKTILNKINFIIILNYKKVLKFTNIKLRIKFYITIIFFLKNIGQSTKK